MPGGLYYHAPYLDATDPEQRNNQQLTGSVSHLMSSKRAGTHDLKGGAEYFVSTGIGGNSQSSTGYVFVTDYATVAGGKPLLDANGVPVPVFTPGLSEVWNFPATRGAKIDIKTTSLYAQDRWSVNRRLTLDLGTRFEAVRSNATGDITAVEHEHDRAAPGRDLRHPGQRQDDGAGELRALRGQVRPGAVLVEQQRGPAERGRLRVYRDRRGRAARSRPAWIRRTTRTSCSRTSRPPTCRWPRGCSRR